jgi:hypothetical protein
MCLTYAISSDIHFIEFVSQPQHGWVLPSLMYIYYVHKVKKFESATML